MAGVKIENVEKSFGSVKVIRNVDIEAEDGEFVVLVGPSGCGKSTLLRMIAGLEEITSGRIKIGERVVNNLNPKDRDIAMVFQNYALYPHMTVRENMEFSLVLRGFQKSEREARVDRAASILGIKELLGRRPGQLSGGQRQRVAMGRAIVRDPQVFLFDEPLSNLDAKLRVQMRGEIRELHRRLGTTCIYVTHDQIEAMTMADRIVVLHDGMVEQVGAPLELYDRPANLFVASFLGSPAMNFIAGRLTAEGAFVSDDGSVTLSPRKTSPRKTPARPGAQVICGFRPEAIVLDPKSPLRLRVALTEPTGAETHVFGRIGGVDVIAVLRERVTFSEGLDIGVSIPPGQLHIFEAASRVRLN
jgi:multiple sugar transport system ATP-binding protein